MFLLSDLFGYTSLSQLLPWKEELASNTSAVHIVVHFIFLHAVNQFSFGSVWTFSVSAVYKVRSIN